METHYEQLNYNQQLEIYTTGGNKSIAVLAHLPEQFGFGFSNEIGSPFASYLSEGSFSKLVALNAGATAKAGLFTRKIFMGPEQQDISLDLKFEAQTDAETEVVVPCTKLMSLGAYGLENGTEIFNYLERLSKKSTLGRIAFVAALALGDLALGANNTQKSIEDHIKYAAAPKPVSVRFGSVYTIPNLYISSANFNFTNLLDIDGYPMEASVSMTLTPIEPFNRDSFIGWQR